MVDIIHNEEEVLAYWQSKCITEAVKAKNLNGKTFYFLDGPPYVTGDLHPGHIWTKGMKDAFVRYRRYRGFNVIDRPGYDLHGLPIENKIEKDLGIKSKKEIEEKIGIERFVQECRKYVDMYMGRMDADYDRFGISLDFKNPYLPYKKEYMEAAWQMLKLMDQRKFLYKGKRTLIYCPHCETPLSQGSMEVEYSDEKDPSLFVAFKIMGGPKDSKADLGNNAYLAVWTTTPWTLPANVAIAVNPKEVYVIAKAGSKRLVLAKKRADKFAEITEENLIIEGEFFGSELLGTRYISPIEGRVPKQKEIRKYHKVIASEEFVTMEEGTGLLHVAPGHGMEDYGIGIKNRLPILSPLNPDATYDEEAGEFKGLKVPAEANAAVLKDLEQSGMLLHTSMLTHSYPHCWRCHSKLIFAATDQWFLNIQRIKSKLIKVNNKINWYPEEVKTWQQSILENSPDWCISRQRYWGIPIPVWECVNCSRRTVIGSHAELVEKALDKKAAESLQDFHRPYIDQIKIKCECSSEMRRIPDVFDVWFDSGITFRASLTEQQFQELKKVDFILEYVEQIRGWFQALMKCGTMAYDLGPIKNIVVHGIMAGSDGRKMSKSFGNFAPLREMLKESTADAFRLWSMNHMPILNRNLSYSEIKDADKNILLIYNVKKLLEDYEEAIGYHSESIKAPSPKGLAPEEQFILSKFSSLIVDVTEAFDNYALYKAAGMLTEFMVEDFSRFYLKTAKKKILYSSKADAMKVINTVNYIFYNLIIMLSPIIPFSTEKVYLERYKGESIFLNSWPKASKSLINKQTETEFDVVMSAITAILNSRDKFGVRLRWPVSSATIETANEDAKPILAKYSYIIEEYVNAKEIHIKDMLKSGTEIRPVFQKLGPDFRENASAVAEAIKSADPVAIEESIVKSGIYDLHTSKGIFKIGPQHFIAVEKAADDNHVQFKYGVAYVDPKISEELKEEALVREFERRVQLLRKDMGLKKTQKVEVFYDTGSDTANIVEKNKDRILKIVAAKSLRRGGTDFESAKKHSGMNEQELLNRFIAKEFDIEGERLMLALLSIS